jgi:hypothetical protein
MYGGRSVFIITFAQRRDPQGAKAGLRTQDVPNGRGALTIELCPHPHDENQKIRIQILL